MDQGEVSRWEYKVLDVTDHPAQAAAEEVLDDLGSEGWELTGIDTSLSARPRYVFKRRLAGFEPVPDMDEAQERWLSNVAMAEALMALPVEERNELLREVLTDEEREGASPPEDFRERVLLYFAQKKEGA